MRLNHLRHALLVALVLIGITQVHAQDEQPDQEPAVEQLDPKAREKIKAAHAAYVTERLGLSSAEAEKFWPIYREYTQKRQEARRQLIEAKRAGKPEKELLDLDLKVKQQELDIEKSYRDRMLQVIAPEKLVRLRQAENDFRRLILEQIQKRQVNEQRRQQMRERSQQRLQQRNN